MYLPSSAWSLRKFRISFGTNINKFFFPHKTELHKYLKALAMYLLSIFRCGLTFSPLCVVEIQRRKERRLGSKISQCFKLQIPAPL